MKKRVITFFVILTVMILIPIIIFPRNASIEDAQYELGLELFKKEYYKDAIIEFKRLLFDMKSKKYKDACYFYIGNAYLSLAQYSEAQKYFKWVVDNRGKSSYHSKSLYLLARSEYLLKNYSAAITHFNSYVSRYPSLDYADNSLYWKGEALINQGKRARAKKAFSEVLKRYPYGNKADAASFKLRLMKLEDEMKQGESREKAPAKEEITKGYDADALARLKEKELHYKAEIDKLNNQIDLLRTEIINLKEMGEGTGEEKELQIEEKLKALVSWENLLKIKEESLNQKERQLDQEYERIQTIITELERTDDE